MDCRIKVKTIREERLTAILIKEDEKQQREMLHGFKAKISQT